MFGNVKESIVILGFDIVGEGSIVFLILVWMLVVFVSCFLGKVMSFFMIGFGFFLFLVSLDFLDEFFYYFKEVYWLSMIEFYFVVVGMVVMIVVLY